MSLDVMLVIIFSASLVIWYIGATIFNRRRGIAAYYWLQAGLQEYGTITTAEWMGSSGTGARLVVEKADKPFRKLEAGYMLENRENFPWFVTMHLKGKRDEAELIFWLRAAPKVEVEVGKQSDADFKELAAEKAGFSTVTAPAGYTVLRSAPEGGDDAARLEDFLTQAGGAVQRVTLQKKAPQVTVKARVKTLIGIPPDRFFTGLQTWLDSESG